MISYPSLFTITTASDYALRNLVFAVTFFYKSLLSHFLSTNIIMQFIRSLQINYDVYFLVFLLLVVTFLFVLLYVCVFSLID